MARVTSLTGQILRVFVVGLLFGIGALSGCVTGDDGGSVQESAPSNIAAFTDETGSIQGLVLTDEIEPIVGAQVGILGLELIATTDEAGRFTLNFVPPGKQTLAVIALGFESATMVVEVIAGQVMDEARFILVGLPSSGPYHTTEIHKLVVGGNMIKATPQCMYASQYGVHVPPNPAGLSDANAKTCQGTLNCAAPQQCEVHYGHCDQSGSAHAKRGCDFTPEWQTIIGEVAWRPTTSVNGRGWSWEILAPNVTRASGHGGSVDQSDLHDWWKLSSRNPIVTRIDRATVLEGSPSGVKDNHPLKEEDLCGGFPGSGAEYPHCDWAWRIFPGWCTINGLTNGAAGCEQPGPDFAFDQTGVPVTIYFSYFIREAAPPEFTAVPDA